MRKLTKKQKQLLDKQDHMCFEIFAVEGLEKKLLEINDYETMWQDANRYLWDTCRERKHGIKLDKWEK